MNAEVRRNAVLREIDRRRDRKAFGSSTASIRFDDVVDAEFKALDKSHRTIDTINKYAA